MVDDCRSCFFDNAFNRTVEELKLSILNSDQSFYPSFNRTVEELKYVISNVLKAGFETFNRTVEELKLNNV